MNDKPTLPGRSPIARLILSYDFASAVRRLIYVAAGAIGSAGFIDSKWQPIVTSVVIFLATWAWSEYSRTLVAVVSRMIKLSPEDQEALFNKLDDATKITATDAIPSVATIVVKDERLAASIPSPTVVAVEPTAIVEVSEKKAEVLTEGGPEPKT